MSLRRPVALCALLAAPLVVVAGVLALVLVAALGAYHSDWSCPAPVDGDRLAGAEPTAAARAEIPVDYLALYRRAGREIGIDWPFLAAIGGQESGHGRNSATSSAGAVGPMQITPGFRDAYGLDGDGDGRVDVAVPADAVFTAASGLRRGGAPAPGGPLADYRAAACRYYGACADRYADYANEVMVRAARYGLAGEGDAEPAALDAAAPGSPLGCAAPASAGAPGGVRAAIVRVAEAELALGLREQGEDQGPPLERYAGGRGERDKPWEGYAANGCGSAFTWAKSGYQRWKSSASWSLSTRVRI